MEISKMESIEKLREIAADINAREIVDHMELYPSCVFDGAWLDAWHDEFNRVIDRLEAEIAERYMELPVDADGAVIRIGDVVESYGEEFNVRGICENSWGELCVQGGKHNAKIKPSDCRHVKPRTVEDVLFDCYAAIDYDKKAEDGHRKDELLRKYAAEIRDLLGGGGR